MHILVDRWVTTSPFLRTVRRFHQWEKSASNQVSKTWSSLHLKVSENAFLAPPAGEKRYILFWTKLTRVHVVQNTRFSPTTPSVQISRRLVLLTQSACWPSHIRGPIRAQSCRNWAQRKQTLRINRRCPDASVTRVQTATRTETVPPPPDVVFFSWSLSEEKTLHCLLLIILPHSLCETWNHPEHVCHFFSCLWMSFSESKPKHRPLVVLTTFDV